MKRLLLIITAFGLFTYYTESGQHLLERIKGVFSSTTERFTKGQDAVEERNKKLDKEIQQKILP